MNVSRHAANLATKVRDVVMETMVHVMKSTCGVAADAATVEVQEEVKYFGDVLEKMEMARCALMSECGCTVWAGVYSILCVVCCVLYV